jgi:SAM-dependent methyltransferase
MAERRDNWTQGDLYEGFIGRWSRPVARRFLAWLEQPSGNDWLDVGCGTGALTETVLAACEPRTVTGIDPSAGFIEFAKAHVRDARVTFEVGDAQALPVGTTSVDAVVSGLEPLAALFAAAGLREVETTAVDVPAAFRDFNDYWRPFLGGQGPAGAYTMSLADAEREELRELLRRRLPAQADGSIPLVAHAWSVKGRA